jgi:hypothetical protein
MKHQKRAVEHKHLTKGYGVRNYVPYLQTTQNQTAQQANTGTTAQNNTYGVGQTNLQGNLGSLYQSLLGGNIPSSFTNPAAATTAYNSNFQQQVAPGMAATLGAGSPAINSQNALGLAQLQGNLYNTGVQNYSNALGQATNYGLTPTGGTGSTTGQGASASQGQSTSNINPLALLISSLLGGGP